MLRKSIRARYFFLILKLRLSYSKFRLSNSKFRLSNSKFQNLKTKLPGPNARPYNPDFPAKISFKSVLKLAIISFIQLVHRKYYKYNVVNMRRIRTKAHMLI